MICYCTTLWSLSLSHNFDDDSSAFGIYLLLPPLPWSCAAAVALLCDNSSIDPDYGYYQWLSAPQGEQGHWGQGWKGGLDLPFWTGKHTHLKWFKTLSRGDVVVFNISCLFDIIEIGIIDIICKFRLMLKIKKNFAEIYDKKVRKWAKCWSWRQNEAVCWILHFHQWPIPIFTAVLQSRKDKRSSTRAHTHTCTVQYKMACIVYVQSVHTCYLTILYSMQFIQSLAW